MFAHRKLFYIMATIYTALQIPLLISLFHKFNIFSALFSLTLTISFVLLALLLTLFPRH